MAAEKSEAYFGRCKCCLKETYLKNMWFTGQNKDEIFGQMLVDCFSIDWMIQGNIEDDKICEECISKLRLAIEFKRQILDSQTEILQSDKVQYIEEDTKEKESSSSQEEEEEEEEEVNQNGDKKTYDDVEFLEEEVLYEETNEDSQDSEPVEKKRKCPKKPHHSEKNKKRIMQYTEEDLMKAVEAVKTNKMTRVKASEIYKIPPKTISKRVFGDYVDGGHGIDQLEPEADVDKILRKHRDNIQSILEASNATPIKGHWGPGYACYSCPQQFADPSQLKKHTFTHGSAMKNVKVKSLTEYIVKLDVTDLKCKICDVQVKLLEDLMVHLKEIHGMSIHMDIPNHIMPFSFDTEVLTCVQCPQIFDTFKSLSEHMNDAHYRNYECVACKRGFVNVRSLKTHSISHGINIFACTYCQKVFVSKTEMIDHEKTHPKSNLKELSSDEEVTDKTIAQNIVIGFTIEKATNEMQNVPTLKNKEHKCKSCPKVFESRSDLLYHLVSVHKPHKCTLCECTFDFQFKLKKHSLKVHASESQGCSKCSKKYGENSKVILDDKKYSCEVCCSRFSKETLYLAHMKTNHGLE